MRSISILKSISVIAALLSAGAAFGIGESNYANDYKNIVQPFYENHGVAGSFSGVDGIKISYRKFEIPNERGAVVILPGRTEPARKFAEVILDTVNEGYSVYIMDHRGQGESGRMVSNSNIGYVRHFDDYVADVDTFVNKIVKSHCHPKMYMLAHSMGGAIAAEYLIQHPGNFNAVALNSPMLKINTSPYPEAIAESIVALAIGVGQGKKYAIGQKNYDWNATFDINTNDVTHSAARWNQERKNVSDMPSLALGGVSNRWLLENIRATHEIKRRAKEVNTPIFILEAGQDTIVKVAGEDTFCSKAKHCTKQMFSNARHEILQEIDSIRGVALYDIYTFFKKY